MILLVDTCRFVSDPALFYFSEGVGIDGGNSKDWESNAKSIHLIKQRGKVKALDEEIHSEQRGLITRQE